MTVSTLSPAPASNELRPEAAAAPVLSISTGRPVDPAVAERRREDQALVREVLAGDVISDTYVYTFQGEYDPDTGLPRGGENPKHYVDHRRAHTVEEFDDLEVVVWVQDQVTKEVYQSEWSQ